MFGLLAAALAAPLSAAAPCPLELPRQTVEVRAPAGWRGYSSSLMRLTGYGMMAGPPESMAYLVPSSNRKRANGAASTWQFAAGSEKWMYCTYDGSAAIQISRRMPDQAAECKLSHVKSQHGGIGAMTVECR